MHKVHFSQVRWNTDQLDYGYGGYYNAVIGYSRYDDGYQGYYNSVTGYSRPSNDSSSRINSYGNYNTHIDGGK